MLPYHLGGREGQRITLPFKTNRSRLLPTINFSRAFTVCLLFVSGRVQDCKFQKEPRRNADVIQCPLQNAKFNHFQRGVPWAGSSHLSPATHGQKGEGDMGRKGKQQLLHSKLPIEGFWNSAAYLDWLEVVGKSFKKYVPKW